MTPAQVIPALLDTLLSTGARKATKYLSERLVVKLSRQHKPRRRQRGESFVLTIGQPNYDEREFITACRKAAEPLPVRKIQLKQWPKKAISHASR